MRRRGFTAAGIALAAGVAVPALRAQPKLEKSKIAISVGGKAAFYYLPLTISEQLGYFKAEGLDIEAFILEVAELFGEREREVVERGLAADREGYLRFL